MCEELRLYAGPDAEVRSLAERVSFVDGVAMGVLLAGWGLVRVLALIPVAGGLVGLAARVTPLAALWRAWPRRALLAYGAEHVSSARGSEYEVLVAVRRGRVVKSRPTVTTLAWRLGRRRLTIPAPRFRAGWREGGMARELGAVSRLCCCR